MANFHSLRVWHVALRQTTEVSRLGVRYGDIASQMRRAAISVASNICEGCGRDSDMELIRFLEIARDRGTTADMPGAGGWRRWPRGDQRQQVVSVKFRTLISGVPAVVVLGRSVDVRRTYPRRPDWMP